MMIFFMKTELLLNNKIPGAEALESNLWLNTFEKAPSYENYVN